MGITAFSAFAQSVSVPTSSEMESAISSEVSTWITIINVVLGFMIFAGLIYVVSGLLSKREMSKGIIIAWILCIVLVGLANTILVN